MTNILSRRQKVIEIENRINKGRKVSKTDLELLEEYNKADSYYTNQIIKNR